MARKVTRVTCAEITSSTNRRNTGCKSELFLKKEKYTGSCKGMRFRMEKFEKEGEETPVLRVSVWPEPYSFDCTPEEEKQFLECTFDADGIAKGADWINERYEAELPRWKKVSRL